MRIVLFDIDGTLISTRGSGKRAMQSALKAHFGKVGPDTYRYDGKTDRQIARELMREEGFDDAAIDAQMASVLEHYLNGLRGELTADPPAIKVHAGVGELLDALEQRSDVLIGLLTGNVQQGAHAKIEAARLRPPRFRIGAFGSDHERRDALPAIARERAASLLAREVAGEDLVIIGDTPNDLTCGRGVCARAIGVATGSYSVAALSEYQAAAVFADFSDTPSVVHAIVNA